MTFKNGQLTINRCKRDFGALNNLKPAKRSRTLQPQGEGRSANRSTWMNQPINQLSGSNSTSQHDDIQEQYNQKVWDAATSLQDQFWELDQLAALNTGRVQSSMRDHRIGPHHFGGSTGYGYGDLGRDAFDQVVADVLYAESAIARANLMSGTHAISTALFGVLRPGDEMVVASGRPYDTLEEVIGTRGVPGVGSLRDFNISVTQCDLMPDGQLDLSAVSRAIKPGITRMVYVQRSCGYASRPTLGVQDIGKLVECVEGKQVGESGQKYVVSVDNCYGEFTEVREPCSIGADVVMGSFIKNPGGTIAPSGGYVAGKEWIVQQAAARMGAPGISTSAGCTPGHVQRALMQGFYLAPATVCESLKAARLISKVMSERGFEVTPDPPPARPHPASPITAVVLGNQHNMEVVCRAVQKHSPVGSYAVPVPGETPGYDDEVIFADGTFVDGSTSELSADGPIRPPYTVYFQGSSHWIQWVRPLAAALQAIDQVKSNVK